VTPLNPQDIIRIHDRIIEETGGSLGLREPGLLAAVAEKPHASFGGEDLYPALADKAAAIFEALCNYRVFVDGNKRTAIACLEYFLHLNGQQLNASMAKREQFTLRIATTHPDLADVARWIQQHAAPLLPKKS
jgi:death on curing protein